MRTFRLIGIAIMAILISVNFIACSSDDDEELIKNDDGIIINQKRLMQIKIVDDFLPATWDFSYDSNGRLIVLNETGIDYGVKYRSAIDYTWGNNVIIAENNYTWGVGGLGEENRNYKETYFLNNNLVRSVRSTNGENITLTYNSANQLIKVEKYNTIESYTWQGEKMTIQTYNNEGKDYRVVYEYTYSGKTCKGYFPIIVWYVDSLCPLMGAHPELVGTRCNQLPDQIYNKDKNGERIKKYTYTFDKDGYVESCTEEYTFKDFNETKTHITIYTFTWELVFLS